MKAKSQLASSETPEVQELFQVIDGLEPHATGFSGVVVRSVGTKYAKQTGFFCGKGAAKTGGRWNRVGIEAVYASLDILTATKEAIKTLSLTNDLFQAFVHASWLVPMLP